MFGVFLKRPLGKLSHPKALYDDYIGEKEWQDDRGIYAAC